MVAEYIQLTYTSSIMSNTCTFGPTDVIGYEFCNNSPLFIPKFVIGLDAVSIIILYYINEYVITFTYVHF